MKFENTDAINKQFFVIKHTLFCNRSCQRVSIYKALIVTNKNAQTKHRETKKPETHEKKSNKFYTYHKNVAA